MRTRFLSLFTLLVAGALLAPSALAQEEQVDAITEINGESTANVVIKYFNAEDCADPASTLYDLTLINGNGVSQAYLWSGTEQAGCEQVSNRTDQTELCRELSGNPRTVGDNATMFDLTLQTLIDADIVDCENTALEGQTYWTYSFRNDNPGGNDVPVTGYGVAPFTVDVTPPQELSITSAPVQTGSSFTVSWDSPTDSQSIPQYRLYSATIDDPDAAFAAGPIATARLDATGITVSATSLTLSSEGEVFLYASAVDQAAVTDGEGNEGPLSVATQGIAAETGGFCDDPEVDCSGCSVSSLMLSNGQPSSGLWVIGLLFAIMLTWRFRR